MWLKRYKHRKMLWHWLLRNDVFSPEYTIVRYGSAYGGWHLPRELIKPDWIVYDFGVGRDISFAEAVLEQHGCAIHAFDPTPRAVAFMKEQPPLGFQFHPVGVWDEDTILKFWQPRFDDYASFSALNLHGTSDYVECEVKTVKTLAAELGHERIDIIKMDIEGAEQRVIPYLIAEGIRPTVLCVEYDQAADVISRQSLQTFLASHRLHRDLRRAGYQLIYKGGWNATYLLCPLCPQSS